MSAQRVFISFCEKDEQWRRELIEHLRQAPSAHARVIRWTHPLADTEGSRTELERFCASADVAFLLVSPAFLASEHHREIELPVLLEARQGGLRLVPVLVQPVSLSGTPLETLQVANAGREALSSLRGTRRQRFWRLLIADLDKEGSSRQPQQQAARKATEIYIPPAEKADFEQTNWEDIGLAASKADAPEGQAALARICMTYWTPVHTYLRLRGFSPEDASDFTQGFFEQLLAKNVLSRVEPQKARFRAYLIVCLNHYIANQQRQHHAKRGPVALDDVAYSQLTDDIPDTSFDRRWALIMLDQAMQRLKKEMGHSAVFDAFQHSLTQDPPQESYTEIAETLGITPKAVAVKIHRMRRRFRELFLEIMRETLGNVSAETVEEELRHVLAAASAESAPEAISIQAASPAPGIAKPEDRGSNSLSIPTQSSPKPQAKKPADYVRFSSFLSGRVLRNTGFLIDVWAYLESQRAEVLERATQHKSEREGGGLGAITEGGTIGPVKVFHGAPITFHIVLPEFEVKPGQQTIWWAGNPANVAFAVRASNQVKSGSYWGQVQISRCRMPIATIHFEVVLTDQNDPMPQESIAEHVKSIFASYATEDRREVLLWARGAKEVGVDVFVDVVDLRAGQDWEKELWAQVPSKDRFCLFWSAPASRSRWVEKEWRCALEKRGIEYIRPVPFADPRDVPPPPELARSKHFNDLMRIVYDYERSRRP